MQIIGTRTLSANFLNIINKRAWLIASLRRMREFGVRFQVATNLYKSLTQGFQTLSKLIKQTLSDSALGVDRYKRMPRVTVGVTR